MTGGYLQRIARRAIQPARAPRRPPEGLEIGDDPPDPLAEPLASQELEAASTSHSTRDTEPAHAPVEPAAPSTVAAARIDTDPAPATPALDTAPPPASGQTLPVERPQRRPEPPDRPVPFTMDVQPQTHADAPDAPAVRRPPRIATTEAPPTSLQLGSSQLPTPPQPITAATATQSSAKFEPTKQHPPDERPRTVYRVPAKPDPLALALATAVHWTSPDDPPTERAPDAPLPAEPVRAPPSPSAPHPKRSERPSDRETDTDPPRETAAEATTNTVHVGTIEVHVGPSETSPRPRPRSRKTSDAAQPLHRPSTSIFGIRQS